VCLAGLEALFSAGRRRLRPAAPRLPRSGPFCHHGGHGGAGRPDGGRGRPDRRHASPAGQLLPLRRSGVSAVVPQLADANALAALAGELMQAVSASYRIASHSLPCSRRWEWPGGWPPRGGRRFPAGGRVDAPSGAAGLRPPEPLPRGAAAGGTGSLLPADRGPDQGPAPRVRGPGPLARPGWARSRPVRVSADGAPDQPQRRTGSGGDQPGASGPARLGRRHRPSRDGPSADEREPLGPAAGSADPGFWGRLDWRSRSSGDLPPG
jgi:hypothetical protein